MAEVTFATAINQALHAAMEIDTSVICYGLGATDPKAILGTTSGLDDRFGPSRVFVTPTSENAVTGIGVGAALGGFKPIMVHQRLDFSRSLWINWLTRRQSGITCLVVKI